MKEDLFEKYNTKVFEIKSNIYDLKKIGFKLTSDEQKIETVESDVNRKIFNLESLNEKLDKKSDSYKSIYTDALKELDKIELSQYNYYKVYRICEELNKKIDEFNIDELIDDVLSLLQAIRDGKIIISEQDKYLIEKVFKTVYEILKIAFVAKKENKIFDAIKNDKDVVDYINVLIKEDIDNIKDKNKQLDISLIKKGKHLNDNNLFDLDLLLALSTIDNKKVNEETKDQILEEIVEKIDTPELGLVEKRNIERENINEKVKVLEKKMDTEIEILEEEKDIPKGKNRGSDFVLGIGTISGAVISDIKFNKKESEELVIGDEEIVVDNYSKYYGVFDNPIFEEENEFDKKDDYSEYGKYEMAEFDDYKDLYEKIEDDDKFYYKDEDKSKIDFDRLPPKIAKELKESKDVNQSLLGLIPAILGTTAMVAQAAIMGAIIGAQGANRIIGFVGNQVLNNNLTNPKTLNITQSMGPINIGNLVRR